MINPFKIFRRREKRNMAIATGQAGAFSLGLGDAQFSSYSVQKAVKEGMRENSWVYRCVSLIMQNASSVPWYVYRDEEIQENHPLSKTLSRPNPHVSRQDFMELMSAWIQLAGNAYAYKTKVGASTKELWPASPDRMTPVPGRAIDEWISGYIFDRYKPGEQKFEPEEIVHLKLMNPANPIVGMSPLDAGSKAIDTDNSMRNFSYKTMENNGRIEGVFMFEREFANLDEAEKVRQKLNEIYGGGRGFAVLGGKAKYDAVASTMAELDFVNSRKFGREEIAIIFGVPIQLMSQETSTYNNFTTAELVFWTLTVIPLLDNFSDAFTMSFYDELADNEWIGYDASTVPALRRAMLDRAETATRLHDMGVPVEQINRIFELGIDEYPGWSMSLPQNAPQQPQQRGQVERKGYTLKADTIEFRAYVDDIEKESVRVADGYADLLKAQEGRVLNHILFGSRSSWQGVIDDDRDEWLEFMSNEFIRVGVKFGRDVVVEQRAIASDLEEALSEYLETERAMLLELSLINESTVSAILDVVTEAVNEGLSTAEISDRITDAGIFDSVRALRLARTLAGNASSLGQLKAGQMSGADEKKWNAHSGAREEHTARDREGWIGINERFSPKFGAAVGPMYPLDPVIAAADRINCRCSLSFRVNV